MAVVQNAFQIYYANWQIEKYKAFFILTVCKVFVIDIASEMYVLLGMQK